ncbi:lrr receptor-like serine threonine-protein kinase [Hordeum vulgare]|nr:lrr receptor-like serine threonine-protein kinase [Hordeum vulgare]
MADAHGDADTAARDVVELQGLVSADELKDVGGIQGGVGKLSTVADVEKEVAVSAKVLPEQKVTASRGAVHPDTRDVQPSEKQEYDSGEDVSKGNLKSFKAKEVEKIKAKEAASFFNRKIKKWRCPYCTTKPKTKDGRFDHLVSHAEEVANRGEDYMIRGQHAALAKALTPV